jgi:hypothetical protein
MTDIYVIKHDNALHPASEQDREELNKIKAGQACKVTVKRFRNYAFHKKFWAMMQVAYDNWDVPDNMTLYEGLQYIPGKVIGSPRKSFDRFRKDIIILAGYYDATYRLNGEVRLEAKSISFHNMDEDEFGRLYIACLDVIREHVLQNMDEDYRDILLQELESFE